MQAADVIKLFAKHFRKICKLKHNQSNSKLKRCALLMVIFLERAKHENHVLQNAGSMAMQFSVNTLFYIMLYCIILLLLNKDFAM
jgi:hypothetical protein